MLTNYRRYNDYSVAQAKLTLKASPAMLTLSKLLTTGDDNHRQCHNDADQKNRFLVLQLPTKGLNVWLKRIFCHLHVRFFFHAATGAVSLTVAVQAGPTVGHVCFLKPVQSGVRQQRALSFTDSSC